MYDKRDCFINKKGYGCNEHKKLSNFAIKHSLKYRNSACIALSHVIVTVVASTLSISHSLKQM